MNTVLAATSTQRNHFNFIKSLQITDDLISFNETSSRKKILSMLFKQISEWFEFTRALQKKYLSIKM